VCVLQRRFARTVGHHVIARSSRQIRHTGEPPSDLVDLLRPAPQPLVASRELLIVGVVDQHMSGEPHPAADIQFGEAVPQVTVHGVR